MLRISLKYLSLILEKVILEFYVNILLHTEYTWLYALREVTGVPIAFIYDIWQLYTTVT
jgi:hypothetical protein